MTKTIRSLRDLAIHGAPPAFAEPIHVGRPNIGDRSRFLERIGQMLDRRWLSNDGPLVKEFEREVSIHLGVKNCVAMCNGTIALEIAIRALSLAGEVIVPSYTFVATAHALYWQGITPVFADIDGLSHTLDPKSVERLITPRTTGILATHLWGRGADHRGLERIARAHGLALLYDAAHAFGCTQKRAPIGTLGRCAMFSFHATKFFNTLEGGAVVTDDDELADRMRLMRNFGFAGYDRVIYPGTNGKMVEACAAMGLTNLECLGEIVAKNRENYHAYRDTLARVPGVSLLPFDEVEDNNFQYVVLELDAGFPVSRDEVVAALHAENVLARRYFWPGCHRMKPYRDLFPVADLVLPETERVSERVVVLPTGNTLPQEAIEVVACVLEQLGQKPLAFKG